MFVTNACHTKLHHRHLQTWHVPRKRWDIWKEHVNWISTWQYLHCYRMTWTRPWNTSRDALMLTGLVTQWRGKAHLALCVSFTTFSWRANVEDRVALSSGESELYALGALSAELIFAQAVLKEIGLSFLIHARADSSTARAVATKQGASRKMKHIHTRFLFIQDLVFRSWCEPERHRDESSWTRTMLQIEIDAWYRDRAVIKTSCKQNVWWSGRVEWSAHVSKRRFCEAFSVQRGTPCESDTASRREEVCLLNIPLPKSMSSPTLCSVWEKWETILLNPARSKFSGIRTTIISANWIELMDNLWNSSGRFSQDSLQWQSSFRFNRCWENYSVNQRTSQAGSSSCQCLTTLCGLHKEMMNYV